MSRDLLELGASLGFLDELYELYRQEPGELDPSWRDAFGAPEQAKEMNGNGAPKVQPSKVLEAASLSSPLRRGRPSPVTLGPITAAPSILPLVQAYRTRGHFAANLDPLGLIETAHVDELDLPTWGFTQA